MSSPSLSGGRRCKRFSRYRCSKKYTDGTCRKYTKKHCTSPRKRSTSRRRRSRSRSSRRVKKSCSSRKGKGWKGVGHRVSMEELRKIVTACKDYKTEMTQPEVDAIKRRLLGKYGMGPAVTALIAANPDPELKDVVIAVFKDQHDANYQNTDLYEYNGKAENFQRDLAGGKRRRSRRSGRSRRSRRRSGSRRRSRR